MQRDLAVCSVSASVGATRHVVHRHGTHWMGRPLARSPVVHTVTAGPGRTDRALDAARPFPALRAGGSGGARPLQGGRRAAEPRRAWALLGMLVQPVQGRGVPRPSPCGAAAPRDVYRPPRRSQRHRDQRPTRGLPALRAGGSGSARPRGDGVPDARRSVRRWCAASWDQLRPWKAVRCLPGGGEAWSTLRRGRPPRHASDWSGAQDRCRAGRSPGRAARRCSIPIGSRVHDRYRESPAQRTRAGTTLAHAARAGLAPSTPLGAHSCGRD
jgi:hypothetical protein